MNRYKKRLEEALSGLEVFKRESSKLAAENLTLQNENRVLKANNEALERETRYLREKLQEAEGEEVTMRDLFCGLRERIYTLLRSADQDAEVFGLPRYTLVDVKTLEHTAVHDDLTAYLGRMEDKYGEDEAPDMDCIYYDHGWCKSVDGVAVRCEGDCAYRRQV